LPASLFPLPGPKNIPDKPPEHADYRSFRCGRSIAKCFPHLAHAIGRRERERASEQNTINPRSSSKHAQHTYRNYRQHAVSSSVSTEFAFCHIQKKLRVTGPGWHLHNPCQKSPTALWQSSQQKTIHDIWFELTAGCTFPPSSIWPRRVKSDG
jgi:hypothetical protein